MKIKPIRMQLFFFVCGFIIAPLFMVQTAMGKWERTSVINSSYVYKLVVHNHSLFALIDSGIAVSEDLGMLWQHRASGMSIADFAFIGDFIIAETPDGFYGSEDFGEHWSFISSTPLGVNAIASDGEYLYCSGYSADIFQSADTGKTWSSQRLAYLSTSINSIIATDSGVFLGTASLGYDTPKGRIFRSFDHGHTWDMQWPGAPVMALASCDRQLYAGTDQWSTPFNLIRSSDHGVHWSPLYSNQYILMVTALCSDSSHVFVGTRFQGVLMISNADTIMTDISDALQDSAKLIRSMAVLDGYLFIGTGDIFSIKPGNGVWRRALSEFVTSAMRSVEEPPRGYALQQNYPNPFNPSTTISFTIPSKSHVSLKIYDAMGREVAKLVSEEMPAGTYLRRWNASGMASGMYFYRLQAGPYSETRRLEFVR